MGGRKATDDELYKAAVAFLRLHHFGSFLIVTVGFGAVQLAIAGVPVPQLDPGSLEYTRAVGFFLGPILSVPVLALTLAGPEPYESQAARTMTHHRIAIASVAVAWIFLTLYPSALTKPTDDAVRVLVENISAVSGMTILIGCWVRARWSWVVVYAPALLGVTGPERGWVSELLLIDRTASARDLVCGVVLLAVALGVYGIRGSAGPRAQSLRGRWRVLIPRRRVDS